MRDQRTRGVRIALALVVATVATACGGSQQAPDLAADDVPFAVQGGEDPRILEGTSMDAMPRPAQVLQDTSGRPFALDERPANELTVLFFGYTHCPDVCPTTMADLAAARAQLPEELRDQVQVVFVTEDPRRDTNQALREWLDQIDPSFVGLRGGNNATKKMLKDLYLSATKINKLPKTPIEHPHSADGHHHEHGRYGVEHTGVVYAWAPRHRAVVYTGGTTAGEYAADFTRLLGSGTEVE